LFSCALNAQFIAAPMTNIPIPILAPIAPSISLPMIQDLKLPSEFAAPAQQLDPFSVGEVISHVQYSAEGLPLQLMAVPLARQIEIHFTEEASLSAIKALFQRLGLTVLSKINPERFVVAVQEGSDADALARLLEQEPGVLFATPKTFELPISEQVGVIFKRDALKTMRLSSGEDIHIFQDVYPSEIAQILRKKGLRVVGIRGDGMRVGIAGASAQDTAKLLADEPYVLDVHAAKPEPAVDRWISVRFVESFVVMTDAGWGIQQSMDDDTVADFLREHNLHVAFVGAEPHEYILEPGDGRPVEDVIAELANHRLIASVSKPQP
jgi:hypothetical protein